MKRLFLLLMVLSGLAAAQLPAYPENAVGLSYALHQGVGVQLGLKLPFSPLGMETGLEASFRLGQGTRATLGTKALVLPSLTLSDQFVAVGAEASLLWEQPNTGGPGYLGGEIGPTVSLLWPSASLSAHLGLAYLRGLHLSYGLGLHVYAGPMAFELSSSDRSILQTSLLYLF